MAKPACSDEEFIALFREHRSATILSKILGIAERNIHKRRKSIEKRHDIVLESNDNRGRPPKFTSDQLDFMGKWKGGAISRVDSVDAAIRALGITRKVL